MDPELDLQTRERIQEHFEDLRAEGGDKLPVLSDLFADLNYNWVEYPLPTREWSEAAREAISDEAAHAPMVLAEAGRDPRFQVLYFPLVEGATQAARLRLTDERAIAQQVRTHRQDPECLMVFSDPQQEYWHFVNVRQVTRREAEERDLPQRHVLRRIAVGPEDKLRTAVERFGRLQLTRDRAGTATLQDIQALHDQAFNVEQITEDFFDEFKEEYFELEDSLMAQTDDREWAHEYALKLLSRLMFVYFIQRKRWIADNPDFMANYWRRYHQATGGDDTFFEQWLTPLFFEAFQDPAAASEIRKRGYIPEDLRDALRNAPYLNGGLFREEKLDRQYDGQFTVSDDYFAGLLSATDDLSRQPGFLERYNFTISEDSPLDQEVAVDPEMIGRVYESLINISEPGSDTADDREEQRKAGIFYTPRTEIDLMCRLALSDYLRNHLGDEHRDLIYELMFALEPEEQRGTDDQLGVDERVAREDLWPAITELLEDVTVVDPACGSGSFLVGMMNILFDLRQRADHYIGENPRPHELKHEIIRTSLYGVDVMDWACHVAELRLWLQLMIHTELEASELQGPKPLLPNLSFKIRQGDSLVQEIGGVNLAHLKADVDIPGDVRSRLRELRADKRRFFDAEGGPTERQERAIRDGELNIFLRICRTKINALEQDIEAIDTQLEETQPTLEGEQLAVTGRDRERLESRREQLEAQKQRLEAARSAIDPDRPAPFFVWDLAFVEIFSGENEGFDIVVGNPPYVRQEKIADPQGPDDQSRDQRKQYKRKLQRSVYAAYPSYFGSDPDNPRTKLGLRSDLYIYFYFHALSLLNSQGAFCFVTSNSWLDVGYGKELQEFLARQVPMHMIIDNEVKRSFVHADVNTIIALFGAPRRERNAAVENTARFVMAQVPFEELLHPIFMMEMDDATDREAKAEFRVFPRTQRELLEEGTDAQPQDENGPLIRFGEYGGDKWGGKYLRAPQIYWEILERAGDRLVPLGQIAKVRRGFTTGANDFFHLRLASSQPDGTSVVVAGDDSEHLIETRFVRTPIIVKAREVVAPQVDAAALEYRLLLLPATTRLPEYARRFVEWGETLGFHTRPSTRGRTRWYSIPEPEMPPIAFPTGHKRRGMIALVPEGVHIDKRFYGVWPRDSATVAMVGASLLSTFSLLDREVQGFANFGQGLLELTVADTRGLWIADPSETAPDEVPDLLRAIDRLGARRICMLYDDVRMPDRRQLDDALLRLLGFQDEVERTEILAQLHEAACRMIWHRLAKSGDARESRQTYDEWLRTGEPFDPNAKEFDG